MNNDPEQRKTQETDSSELPRPGIGREVIRQAGVTDVDDLPSGKLTTTYLGSTELGCVAITSGSDDDGRLYWDF